MLGVWGHWTGLCGRWGHVRALSLPHMLQKQQHLLCPEAVSDGLPGQVAAGIWTVRRLVGRAHCWLVLCVGCGRPHPVLLCPGHSEACPAGSSVERRLRSSHLVMQRSRAQGQEEVSLDWGSGPDTNHLRACSSLTLRQASSSGSASQGVCWGFRPGHMSPSALGGGGCPGPGGLWVVGWGTGSSSALSVLAQGQAEAF